MPNVVYHADIAEMSGSQVDMVYTRARSGPTRRSRVMGTNPRTPAQSAARMRLALSASAYSNLDAASASLWEAYAKTQTARNPLSGAVYAPAAVAVFNALSTKFLQITPGGSMPLTPPEESFVGDVILVTAAAATGGVAFTASHANNGAIKTELLLQRLASPMRKPNLKAYRSQGFVGFTAGSLTHLVSAASGVYAAAFRFVLPATGQDSVLTPLGIVTVG